MCIHTYIYIRQKGTNSWERKSKARKGTSGRRENGGDWVELTTRPLLRSTASYSPRGDTRSISIQRISCRVVPRPRRGRIVVVVLQHIKASRTGTSTLQHARVAGSEYVSYAFSCTWIPDVTGNITVITSFRWVDINWTFRLYAISKFYVDRRRKCPVFIWDRSVRKPAIHVR